MKTPRSYHPCVEELESIALLSVGGPGPASADVLAVRHPSTQHHLVGSASGTWTAQSGIPDVGVTQELVGSGRLNRLGAVRIRGTLHLLGFIASGHADGTLTLTNPHGSLTLALTGPTQPGFSGPPDSLTFAIASGTGRYTRWHGSGHIDFQETAAMTFTMRFAPVGISAAPADRGGAPLG